MSEEEIEQIRRRFRQANELIKRGKKPLIEEDSFSNWFAPIEKYIEERL